MPVSQWNAGTDRTFPFRACTLSTFQWHPVVSRTGGTGDTVFSISSPDRAENGLVACCGEFPLTTDSPEPVESDNGASEDDASVPERDADGRSSELSSIESVQSAEATDANPGATAEGSEVTAAESPARAAQAGSSPWPRRVVLTLLVVAAGVGGWFGFVEYRLYRARALLKQRDVEAALTQLESLEKIKPGIPEVAFLMARANRRLGRMQQTQTWLEEAFDRGFSERRIMREQWLALAQDGQISLVEKHLWDMLVDPNDEDLPEICEAYINGYVVNYRLSQAFELLSAWKKDYPEDPQPLFLHGRIAEHRGDNQTAAKLYTSALGLAEDRTDIRIRLARCLTELHRYEEAIEQYGYLQKVEDDADMLTDWAQCLIETGKSDRAATTLERALKLDPEHFNARLGKARLAFEAGKIKEALQAVQQLYEERQRDSDVRYLLAQVLQADGQAAEAEKHFDYVNEAIEALNEAMQLIEVMADRPNDAEARYQCGALLLKSGDLEAGAGWLRSALQMDADHRPAHRALAAFYREQGLKTLAARHEQHLADLEDESPDDDEQKTADESQDESETSTTSNGSSS